jgi:hypothetical protein
MTTYYEIHYGLTRFTFEVFLVSILEKSESDEAYRMLKCVKVLWSQQTERERLGTLSLACARNTHNYLWLVCDA